MNGKLIGSAVGMALDNREALKDMSAPVRNATAGAAQVIFRTLWKSTAYGAGFIVLWMGAFATTTVLTGMSVLTTPAFTALFGMFLFLFLPAIIAVRESRKVSKDVSAKNAKAREMVRIKREQQEREMQAIAEQDARQQQAIMAWYNQNPQGQPFPASR